MKKYLFRIIYIVLILFPIITYAEGIENFYINATLEPDGDLRVQEYFNLEGEFNGFQRIINYANDEAYTFKPELEAYGGSNLHNGNNIYINEIRAVKIDSNFNFESVNGDKFTKVESADKGDYGVYTTTREYNGYTYTIYLPSDEEKAFYIDYTITNLAILHNDVGELGWNLFTDLNESIENLEITINFPNNKNEFRVWAHGPLNGVVNPKDKNKLIANVKHLGAYRALDVRATFDKEVINKSTKKTNVQALSKILKYEEDKAAQANYERQQKDFQAQEKAYDQIWYCYDNLNRSCYNEAHRLVNYVNDKNKKEELLKQLIELNILITEIEENQAKEDVQFAEEYLGYTWYERAYESTMILTNKALKEELLTRLEVVEKKLTKEEEENYRIFKAYMIGTIVATITIMIYIYYYHDREYQISLPAPYIREIPNHYSPSTVKYLFDRKITSDAISAEILKLINAGALKCEKIVDKKNKTDHIISKNNEYKGKLNAKEESIIILLLGSQNSIKLSDFKKKASKSYRSFLTRWDSVIKNCTNEAIDEDIYVDDELAKYKKNANKGLEVAKTILTIIAIIFIQTVVLIIPGIILLVISSKLSSKTSEYNLDIQKNASKRGSIIILVLLLLSVLFSFIYGEAIYHFIDVEYGFSFISIILIIIAIIYVGRCKKRTETGAYEYSRWKAFKKFLLDFGKMDIKEIGEIKLWNEYLVYATVLGCADKVEKAMKVKVKDLNLEGSDDLFTDIYIHTDISDLINRGIREAHSKAVATEAANSSSSSSSGGSSWSSGGGGGGGFSSGGGSFGGGGGGGRF